jgi:hypothetical protein
MTSRPWHIVRWFGFLAVGAAIAVGTGMRFRAKNRPADAFAGTFEPAENPLVATPPRLWLVPEKFDDAGVGDAIDPQALAIDEESAGAASQSLSRPAMDPTSPEAEQAIDEVVAQLARFAVDVSSVQIRTAEERGNRRFVFSCDVPTGSGAESFVGEGPDPPSAARHALSRIRAWAAAPSETTLR